MSPVPSPISVSSGAIAGNSLPILPAWNNRVPDYFRNFKVIDGRQHYLQAQNNLWLEMHPDGVRGLNATTKYCILSLWITTLVTPDLLESQWNGFNNFSSKGKKTIKPSSQFDSNRTRRFAVQSNETKMYLCMDNNSVVYQSVNWSKTYCEFSHTPDTTITTDKFYRQVNETSPKWFVGINRDGTIRCGNVTRVNQKGATFRRSGVKTERLSNSPPFGKQSKLVCCPRKRCKNKNKRRRNRKPKLETGVDSHKVRRKNKKCKNYKKCQKWRRKFFNLSLKELKKYYKNCVLVKHVCGDKKS